MARSRWGRKVLQGHLLFPLFLPVVQELSPALPWGREVLLLVGSGLLGGQSWLSSSSLLTLICAFVLSLTFNSVLSA